MAVRRIRGGANPSAANGGRSGAANVADIPHQIVFPNAPGTWRDGVKGDVFTSQGNMLTVAVPAHGIRLMQAA